MLKRILLAIAIIILATTCRKGLEADNLFIRGRLFLADTLIQNESSPPLSFKKVTLSTDKNDTLNFRYSDSTDRDGYFVFTLLAEDKDKTFYIRFNDSLKTYYYKASNEAHAGDNNIILNATLDESKQNGFVLYTKDETNGIIPNVKVRMYGSLAIATLNDTAGAIQAFTSDINGRFFRINVPAGSYYFNASKTVDTIAYELLTKKITVTSTGIIKDVITMKKKTPDYKNGFTITVKDSLNGPIPGATIYIYNSQVLAASNDPTGAISSIKSDSVGAFSRFNYPAGTYFINAIKKVDTITYQRLLKRIDLAATGFVTDTMAIFRKP